MRRHRAAVASHAALAIAAGAVLAYAVAADGYRSLETELNDGGIWVVNGVDGIHGRVNKPINQLDAIVFDEDDVPLDVVQDGAAVVTLNRRSGVAQVIDPATSAFADGARVSVPAGGDLQLAGGTLASLNTGTGEVWAVPVDTVRGTPLISAVDRQAEALAEAGESAALAVSATGTVVVTSAEEATVTVLEPQGDGFAQPRTDQLAAEAGSPTAVTTVGEHVVTFDAAAGRLAVRGGGTASLPEDSVLQQPGPVAQSVLVATSSNLLAVDLRSGETSVVADGVTGRPTEPVRLGACGYGAWSGGLGAVAVQCGDAPVEVSRLGGRASNLAFRVNRGEIVLNDASSGSVWDVELDKPQRIDNWDAFTATKKVEDKDEQDEQQSTGDRRPPKAEPDSYGARPGRTTVLHPLDNDSAPEGRLLSIVAVDQPVGGARATISPDGQTVVLQMPADARATTFEYFIDDGRNLSASAEIAVTPRRVGQNTRPALRDGFANRVWRVPAGGSLAVPVVADWRDDADGDPLVLDSASVAGGESGGASARTTSDGRVRFTAPAEGGGQVRVQYAVTDGQSEPVSRNLTFSVQDKLDQQAFAATAEPDVVRGEVGQPVKIRPLLNDLPGSDPTTPHAELALGGRVVSQPNTSIRTDLENGVIHFRSDKPGTYFLDYDAAYGNAPLARNKIRVDVQPRPRSAQDPVAMPDTLTVYGQVPATVDVLANDLDPTGGLLVVQRSTPEQANQLDVAVIDGRWLRVSVRQGDLQPNPQVVRYTVSNGTRSGVEGEVVVSQRAVPVDNSPVTTTDRVTVRAGSSVTASVLDNDLSPSGDKLSLVGDVADGVPGELPVKAPIDVTGDVGRAFVSGRTVRYVAPPGLEEQDSYEVPYVAANSTGQTAPGLLIVTIVPAGAPSTAPDPPTLEGRVVSGDTMKVRLPGSGVDPEGDPVTVTGIDSAPRLGRVLAFGANFVEYQAFPRTAGTDEFSYSVVDARGSSATGTIRVGVVPPGTPQPPLAVADLLTVEPGRTATFDPLANDYVAAGDQVRIDLQSPPEGVALDRETGLVTVQAPADLDAPAVTVVYSVSNGMESSRTTMTLRTAEDYNNPPVVYDAYGRADDSGAVSVDVLEGAYDPDGRESDLRLAEAYGGEGVSVVTGTRLRAARRADPQIVPFRVEDAEGGAATASLYVPPTGTGIPYVRPGALIELEPGGSARGRLSDLVVDPSGGRVRLTGREAVSASPAALSPSPDGDQAFEVSASADYRGPGAVLLEVTTAADRTGKDDPEDPSDGATALLSIPVQVGDDTPVLECPETTIPISQGERYSLDISSLCIVWTLDPRDAPGLEYQASWTTEVSGLSLSQDGSPLLQVAADERATSGGQAVLSVRGGDSNAEEIRFRLAKAPPPTLLPIRVEEMRAGESRTVDLAPYLEPGVARPEPTVVSVVALSGTGVSATTSGGASVLLRAGKEARGRAVFRVVLSDVADSAEGSDRRVEGRIEFEVRGLPGAPSEPYPFEGKQANKVSMGWFPPKDDGGSPITHYVVEEVRTNKTQTCRTNRCDFTGLKNGQRYNFRVKAVNKVGAGPWSGLSRTAYADTAPGRVHNIRLKRQADRLITIAWDEPITDTSKVLDYTITWQGGSAVVPGDQLTYSAVVADNNAQYVFTIKARNAVNYSLARSSAPFQSLGTPLPPEGVSVADLQSGANQTAVRVGWAATLPEGPGPTTYTVTYSRNGRTMAAVPGCSKIQALQCIHAGIDYNGDVYDYAVRAHNQGGNTSAVSAAATFDAVGKPSAWGAWEAHATGANQQVRVTAVAPDPRGSQAQVAILVGGQVVRELSVAQGQGINETVSTPSNESAYPVQLRICNENAAKGGCTVSDVKSVQSYGPLDGMLSQPAPGTSQQGSKAVSWSYSGTANGNPAQVTARVSEAGTVVREETYSVGPGSFSFSITATASDFASSMTLEVTLQDPDTAGRGSDTKVAEGVSGQPPLPSVSVSRGGLCGDLPGTTRSCQAEGGGPGCYVNSCSFVVITTSAFVENYRCSIDGALNGGSGDPGVLIQNYPGGYETDWYAAGGTITVRCTDTTGRQVGSGQTNWAVGE